MEFLKAALITFFRIGVLSMIFNIGLEMNLDLIGLRIIYYGSMIAAITHLFVDNIMILNKENL